MADIHDIDGQTARALSHLEGSREATDQADFSRDAISHRAAELLSLLGSFDLDELTDDAARMAEQTEAAGEQLVGAAVVLMMLKSGHDHISEAQRLGHAAYESIINPHGSLQASAALLGEQIGTLAATLNSLRDQLACIQMGAEEAVVHGIQAKDAAMQAYTRIIYYRSNALSSGQEEGI